MILCNSDSIDQTFNYDAGLRRCVMATTVMTPKLILLLDMVQTQYKDSKAAEVAFLNRRKCINYIHNCISNVMNQSPTTLRLAANLYYLYDDVLVTSSIRDKIIAWKTAYQIAEKQVRGSAPVKVTVSDIPFLYTEFFLPKESIEQELNDFSDEIESWLDIYITEYNDFDESDEQDIYNEIVSIMTDLRFLAGILPA